jgi:hypothetical protein
LRKIDSTVFFVLSPGPAKLSDQDGLVPLMCKLTVLLTCYFPRINFLAKIGLLFFKAFFFVVKKKRRNTM